jgi:hypothetical protein
MREYIISTTGTGLPINYKELHVSLDREWYEEDLRRRQKEHLDRVQKQQDYNWRPCMHDSCPECLGTGIKHDGSMCVHYISCPCPKCTPTY